MKDTLIFHMDNDNYLRQTKIAFNSLPLDKQTDEEWKRLCEDRTYLLEILKPLLPANFYHTKKSLKIQKREYGPKDR